MAEGVMRRIALIGAMGSGKSTVARLYAERYGKTIYDTDKEFTRRYGDITAFFERFGEERFRAVEDDILVEAADSTAEIIACGGGSVLCKRGMNALRKSCDIVRLTAPINVLRTRIEGSSRPLAGNAQRLLAEREPLYKRYADYTVDTDCADVLRELESTVRLPRAARYDVLLCDADDTILDFRAAMRAAIIATKAEFGIKSDDDRLVAAFRKCTDEVFLRLERGEIARSKLGRTRFEMLCEMLGEDLDGEQANAYFFEEMKKTRFVREGATTFLDGVRSRGIKVYIITNSFTDIARERLKALHGHIDGAFVSEEVGYDKPDVRFFERVHDAIGKPDKSRVLVFGDSVTSDIAGGANFGVDTCLYDPFGTKSAECDHIVRSYIEISALL